MAKLIIAMGLLSIIKFFTGCSDSSLFFNYGYNIRDAKVYYKQPFPEPVITMEGVDVASFKVMSRVEDSAYADNTYYATDKHSVYYRGRPLPGGHGPSFQLINVSYAKDRNQCYYKGNIIQGADPATFVIKSDQFSADKEHIFKRDAIVDDDPSVFETFYEGYVVHTANTVCVYDAIVPIPSGTRFHYLAFAYFALNNQIYHQGVPLPGGDAAGFVAFDNFFSKTAAHVYYGSKLLEGADPDSYQLLEAPYGRDANHVFYFEREIAGADAKTFAVLNIRDQCARDKGAVYYEDKKVKHFTPADLTNKNACISCNEATIHFAE